MGLFSNKKKLCPICGEPTPRLFATKVEEMPLCKECAKKIFLPDGALDQMSLDDFKAYMNYYEENQVLRDKFQPEYELGVDFGMYIKIDTKNGLFSLSSQDNALVFEKSCIETYRILEEDDPLFQGNKTAIKFFNSKIPHRVREMGPMITQFQIQKREYEMLERMEDFLDKEDDNRNRPYRTRPSFDGNEPFDHFSVRVRMEHPYWQGIHRGKYSAPLFDRQYPRIDDYMRDYNERVETLRELANKFKELVNPNSKVIYDGESVETTPAATASFASAPQAAANVDVVEEVKRYKGLFDAGIITEEEFVAKKKQLMGI